MKNWFKYFLVVSVAAGVCVEGYGQAVTWQREYPILDDVEGTCITQTFDGGYIMAGLMYNDRNFIVRTDEFGDTLWTKIYQVSLFKKIIQTIDSNFIFVGNAQGPSGFAQDAYIMKTDQQGNILWWKKFGIEFEFDSITDVVELESENLLYFGFSRFSITPSILKYFILKTNSNGDSLLMNYYENSGGSGIMDLYKPNEILLSGSTNSIIDTNGALIRFTPIHLGKGIADTIDYSFFFIKDTIDSNDRRVIKLTKTDTLFNEVWSKYITAPFGGIYGNHIIKSKSGFVICGDVFTTFIRGFLLEFDNNGETVWYKEYSLHPRSSFFTSGYKCKDNGFVTVGTILPEMFGTDNILATKTDSVGNTTTLSIKQISDEIPEDHILYQNYPNPFNSQTTIKFEIQKKTEVRLYIHDILGRELEILVNDNLEAGVYSYLYKPSYNLSSGVYFYSIHIKNKLENKSITKKLLLIK
jgi:hypothetical protein